MKSAKAVLALVLLGLALSGPALAGGGHRPHLRFGVGIAAPILLAPAFYPPYSYYPRYYAPPVVSSPPVYVERSRPRRDRYWYYCASAGGYYPYVATCPGGWQRVAPHPPRY